ncbi:MAG TPA: helix-turn-helix transcriptional regulator [Pedococcus sp.]|nr:helix-turn-helix transcriptional regulator [Pedococcus sp.]
MSEPDISLAVGQELRRIRVEGDIRTRPLAATLRIGPSSLSAYEAGRRPITVQRLYEMCRALDVDPCEVLRVAIANAEQEGRAND